MGGNEDRDSFNGTADQFGRQQPTGMEGEGADILTAIGVPGKATVQPIRRPH